MSGKPDWPLGGYAPGSYFCKCHDCGEQFEGDKRAMQCLPCAVRSANAGLDRLKGLEVEVQAAKDFGGGFYGEAVTEQTRQLYRDEVGRKKAEELAASLRMAAP
jgi:hypothetical protein